MFTAQTIRRINLSENAERRRLEALPLLSPAMKSELGQFMTPLVVANYMASLFSHIPVDEVHLLDPGAGVGSLSAAFIQKICANPGNLKRIFITAYEIDPALAASLRGTMEDCVQEANDYGIKLTYELLERDFIKDAYQWVEDGLFNQRRYFSHIITNPPYKKIASQSVHRHILQSVGVEVTNLYAAFISLAIKLLSPGGELVAISPRSFCNGPYFLPFRKLLLSQMSIQQIHVFEARDIAFKDDAVLQENIIYHATKNRQSKEVKLSTSHGIDLSDIHTLAVPYSEIVHANDADFVIHLPTTEEDSELGHLVRSLKYSLKDLKISVSTGPVIDFRLKEYIHKDPRPDAVPLIYPAHFKNGNVSWPKINGRKPNMIDVSPQTKKWLMPGGFYTLTRRFSAKEEKRRIVAAVLNPEEVQAEWLGFENHLNVFHEQGHGLPPILARGLALYLNSTIIDRFFRLFNGHTQVNATDLRALSYPSRETLVDLGGKIGPGELPSQEITDQIVQETVFSNR
jgi:adenine-specific DNA-methyltransferase